MDLEGFGDVDIIPPPLPVKKGRGSAANLANRFEHCHVERDPERTDPEDPAPATRFYKDLTRSIIATNDSPDIGFKASLNAYRGCEHGCIYCYARPTHEYLGLSAGLDFESKIFVKENGPELLRQSLASRKWVPQLMVLSGVTDCYQPAERRLRITRRCLEVLAECRNPVAIITKNELVARDIDLFQELAKYHAISVCLSVTTLDGSLSALMEPRASHPQGRLRAIALLHEAGIPVGINIAPVIPGLTDHEIPAILEASAKAGTSFAGYVLLRLPHGVKSLFETWLRTHYPARAEKVLHRIRETRNGELYDSRFSIRQKGEGRYAEHIAKLFQVAKTQARIPEHGPSLSTAHFRRPLGNQLALFE